MDPGKHEIELFDGPKRLANRTVVLDQAEERTIVMDSAGTTHEESDGSTQRTWGYVTLGLGGAALVTGVAAGVVMLDKKSSLDDVCSSTCPPAAQNDLDTFRTARTTSFIGYGVGIAAIGAGTVLLLTAPSAASEARLTPLLGPRQIGLRGTF